MSTISSTSATSTPPATFSGLATGIDTDTIITKLMGLERAPITRLETKKTAETDRLAAYAQFKTTIDDLKSAVSAMTLTSQVKSTSASLSAGAPFTATSANASSRQLQHQCKTTGPGSKKHQRGLVIPVRRTARLGHLYPYQWQHQHCHIG